MADKSKDKVYKRKKGESEAEYFKRISGLTASEYKTANKYGEMLEDNKVAPEVIKKLRKKFNLSAKGVKKGTGFPSALRDVAEAGKLLERDKKRYAKSKASPKEKQKYTKEYKKSAKSDLESMLMYGKKARRGKGYMRRPKALKSGGKLYRGRSYANGGRVAKYNG